MVSYTVRRIPCNPNPEMSYTKKYSKTGKYPRIHTLQSIHIWGNQK